MKLYTLSAGVVVIHQGPDGCRYLLLRAYHYWDFPKGIVEPGEDPLEAARREVAEETALQDLEFSWGAVYLETTPYGAGKIARYYLAETRTDQIALPVSAELGRPEHDEYRWLSHTEARALLPTRLLPILDWAHELAEC